MGFPAAGGIFAADEADPLATNSSTSSGNGVPPKVSASGGGIRVLEALEKTHRT
jgi:hypothetical protein